MKPPSDSHSRQPHHFRVGFSLIELMAVLVILGMVAGVVAVSVKGRDARMRMVDVAGELRQFEHQTREHARTFRKPTQLVFDLRGGTIGRVDADGQAAQTPPLRLPRGFGLSEVRLPERTVREGEVAVTCSSLGMTPTYAVLVSGPQEQKRWFVFGGLTGAVAEPESGEAVEAMHAQLKGPAAGTRP